MDSLSLKYEPFIQGLPAELIDEILQLLPRSDIPSVRRTCKYLAARGLRYLLTEAHTILTKASFQRLLETSESPIAQEYITSLLLKGDMLNGIHYHDTRNEWERKLEAYLKPHEYPSSVTPYADHMRSAFKSAIKSNLEKQSELRTTAYHYHQYLHFYENQQAFVKTDYKSTLALAMSRLSHLRSITYSLWNGVRERNDALDYTVCTTLYPAWGEVPSSTGFGGLWNLLAALHEVGVQLESLHFGCVSYHSIAHLERFGSVLRGIRSLSIVVFHACPNILRCPHHSPGSTACPIVRFIRNAPNLQVLKFTCNGMLSATGSDLIHVVGNYTWQFLHTINLAGMNTTEARLVDFFRRHATTLREVGLAWIRIYNGSWKSALPKLRAILKLQRVNISGWLMNDQPKEIWCLDGGELGFHKEEATRMKAAVEHYLLHGGECPFDDLKNYPVTKVVRFNPLRTANS